MASSTLSGHPHAVRSRLSYLERHPTTTAAVSVAALVLVGVVTGELLGRLAVLLIDVVLSAMRGGA